MEILLLKAKYEINISNLEAGNKNAQKGLEETGKKAKSTGEMVLARQRLKTAGESLTKYVTAPLLAFASKASSTSATFDSLKLGLKTVEGSAEKAEIAFNRMKEVAKLPGLNFKDAVQGYTNLRTTGISANLAERALKSFGNALASAGKGNGELDGVIQVLSQIQSK